MKVTSQKKLGEIRNRVRDLKSSFHVQLKSADEEKRIVYRVSGQVIREADWLVKLCRSLTVKAGKYYASTDSDRDDIMWSNKIVEELKDAYSSEIQYNLFIPAMSCDFVVAMEKMVLLATKIDKAYTAVVARQAESLDEIEEDEEELASNMLN